MRKLAFILCFAPCCVVEAQPQVSVAAEYTVRSDMHDADGNSVGGGDMLKIAGLATLPLSVKSDAKGVTRAWTATLKASFAMMDNDEVAATVNPDRLLNASLNISHMRRLSDRWRLMASLGAGVYSDPSEIGLRSVLANGAAIFAYSVNDRLSIGVGGGLTNSYGAQMVLPMAYLNWRSGGRINVNVDIANSPKVKLSTRLSQKMCLELTAIEVDGMSAVTKVEGKTKIYSSMMMKSRLSLNVDCSKKSSLQVGVGGCWMRSVRLSDRSLKGFFNSFGDDDGKYRFKPAMQMTVAFRQSF